METNDVQEQLANQADSRHDKGAITPSRSDFVTTLPGKELPCPTCGSGMTYLPSSYIYALGRIEARFPSLSLEKEFAQIVGRTETNGKTDPQVFQEVLSRPENRYLVRKMCWVFSVQGLETYLLQPRDPADFNLLVSAIRPAPKPSDIDLVVGVLGPIASPEMCNGLMVPIVIFDQIYSFTRDDIIQAIPTPEKKTPDQFRPVAEEVFDRIMLMTDNAGATDEHRAYNYLAMRYPAIFARTAEQFERDFALSGIEMRPSLLSSTRRILEAIFSYTDRKTDFTEKFFVRVDVNEEFPFLVTRLSPYFER